jgi:glycerol-3-phosphate acyltransferase PlsY
MTAHPMVAAIVVGYFLGSIPFGYMLVRIFRGADVRATGSGNIGATNVARTSPVLGMITLLLDAAKGLCAVALTLALLPQPRGLAFLAAFSAICGHIFPLWLGFRGGKGVATGLGSFLLLTPKAILIAIAIFLAVAALFRWIALASIVATASLPALAWPALHLRLTASSSSPAETAWPMLWLAAGAVLIIVKHQSNIRRLISGTEPRFQFKSR